MRNALPLQSFLALLGWGVWSLGVSARVVSPGELPEVVDQQGEKGHNLYPIDYLFQRHFYCLLVGCFTLSCKTLTPHLE